MYEREEFWSDRISKGEIELHRDESINGDHAQVCCVLFSHDYSTLRDCIGERGNGFDEGVFPGLVVIQEWWGLNDHIRREAERLAAEGYVALAVDLYYGMVATTTNEARAAMRKVTQ